MKNEKSKRIFIVDDDPFWNELLKEMLHSIGYFNVLCFESGEACINYLGQDPEIIFLDYKMKDDDGITTLKNIKKRNSELFVIFTTGTEDVDVAVNAMKYGSFDFFLKTNVSEQNVKNILDSISLHQKEV